jgi:hypothetical protein
MAEKKEPSAKDRKAALDKRKKELPVNYWQRGEHTVRVGNEQFRVRGYHSGKLKLLSEVVESVNWEFGREDRVNGTAQLRRPGSEQQRLGIGLGDKIALDFKKPNQKRWRRLLQLRVHEATRTTDGGAAYTLQDDLVYLGEGEESWNFKRRKSKKKGYLPIDIVKAVARRKGVRLGRVYKGRHRIKSLVRENQTALDMIRLAYRKEREETGKRFIISMVNGKLNILPLKRSPSLLEIGPLLIEASIRESMNSNFATVVTATATGKKQKDDDDGDDGDEKGKDKSKSKKKDKIEVIVRSKALERRWGRIHRKIEVEADDAAQARKLAKRELKERAEPKREVTFSHPGIPLLRRGHALRLFFPKENLRQVVFVKEVSHDATPGEYSMEVTVSFDDPYLDAEFERSEALRCINARKRKREPPKGCEKKKDKPEPKSRENRKNQ